MVQKAEARGRGRPRAYDPDQALARAREAFSTSGFSGTSLDDLAAATGMNRPSLYAAFGDKRALYIATLEGRRDGVLEAADQALGSPGGLKAVLTRAFQGAINAYVSGENGPRGCFLVGTAVTEAVGDARIRAILHDNFLGLDARIAARLDKAVAEGELPEGSDTAGLAFLLTSALHSLAIRARSGEPRSALDNWAAKTIQLVAGLSRA